MKKSFGKVLFCAINLALAIFSTTVGIYAIISAKMNMSLNVGYLSYNCSANVSGVITGASLDGESAPADIPLTNVMINGKNKQTQSMSLGTFYFTTIGIKNAFDKPHPIKVWFTIQNTSEFPICVEVELPTITDVEVVSDKTYHVIQAGASDTIMVTFTLTNLGSSALNNTIASNGLSFTFKKFLKTKQDIVVYKDATVTHFENHPYYIKFGKYYGFSDIYWLVGGTIDANGQTVALTEADRTQLDTGKLAANKNYYLICARSLYGNKDYMVIPVQNNFYWGESPWSQGDDSWLIEYPQVSNVLDYSLSTIRQYLNGHTVYGYVKDDDVSRTITPDTSKQSSDFVELYNFDTNIYALIQKRSLSSIYQTLGYGNTPIAFPTGKADNLTINEADAFWIPTEADLGVLGDDWIAYHADGKAEDYYTFTQQSGNHYKKHMIYEATERRIEYCMYDGLNNKFRPAFII